MNTTVKTKEETKDIMRVSKNVIATVNFKNINLENAVITKDIIFLEAQSSRQIFYRISDYMYSKGYTGFEIKDFRILEDNMIVNTDLIISVETGKMISFNK